MYLFIRYEVKGCSYVTADLTFDLAYWFQQGVDFIEQTTEAHSLGRLSSRPHPIHIMHRTNPDHNRLSTAKDRICQIPKGRVLLAEELKFLLRQRWEDALQYLYLEGKVSISPGVNWGEQICNRCGQSDIIVSSCATCQDQCAYCRSCLQMGRSKVCIPLYYIYDRETLSKPSSGEGFLQWTGTLTEAQKEASLQAVNISKGKGLRYLVWAVCGAGKTEVVFGPIDAALQQGQKVLLVTPRKDVVLELSPRIQQAFPGVSLSTIHGSSTEKWKEADITLSTTHQAICFYQKFDLVILDEVDAFPFHNNPTLYHAVERAKRPDGNLIYLSATPPKYLRSIPHIRIPARYHRKPLAVPQMIFEGKKERGLSPTVVKIIQFLVTENRQSFFFVPFIESVDKLVNQLIKLQPQLKVEGTHSRDPLREKKVKAFRQGESRILVTTTIMERGVTVPKTDVMVFGADAPIFDEASLVQISGRAGRSVEDPIGHVVFIAGKRREKW